MLASANFTSLLRARRRSLLAVEDSDLGVYVHVPFCERVCPYCDFAVVAARPLAEEQERSYVDALLQELALRRTDFDRLPLQSIYLGGGTPSLLEPRSVARIIAAIRSSFPPCPDRLDGPEVTLEVNPSSVERERLPDFLEAGVNRLSVGIQSFDDGVLKRLGRAHRAEEGRLTLRAARDAGFENISIDILYGVPGQSPGDLTRDLDEVVEFAPEHVSAYELSIEVGTPFATAVARGQLTRPSEDDSIHMFELVPARLAAAWITLYELSNLARAGLESVHNRRYWQRWPVLGLGVGAWSTEPRSPEAPYGARRSNVRSVSEYLTRIREDRSPLAEPLECFDAETARGEAIFLALRMAEGLSAKRFVAEFGSPPREFFACEIERFTGQGLLVETPGGDLRLTPRGRLVSDTVFEAFVSGGATR